MNLGNHRVALLGTAGLLKRRVKSKDVGRRGHRSLVQIVSGVYDAGHGEITGEAVVGHVCGSLNLE